MDSNGVIKDTTQKYESCSYGCPAYSPDSCTDCDTAYVNNKLRWADPCNGNPDTMIIQRTPFDTYKLYLYAINNGKRNNPTNDSSGYSVYDSVLFRVVPPRPVLHGVSPYYVLNGRQDSLSLAVSGLWIDSTASFMPAVKVRWIDKYGTPNQTLYPLTNDTSVLRPMKAGENHKNWKLGTNAEWEIRFPTASISIDTTGETYLYVSVVNVAQDIDGDSISTISDEVTVAYVYNPDDIECPASFYGFDEPNSDYVMNWIGNYPSDSLSPNDSIYVRFTELHDLNPSHYTVKLVKKISDTLYDSASLSSFKVDYDGIRLKLPGTIEISDSKQYRLITRLINDSIVPKCYGKNWGSHISYAFSTVPEETI